VYVISYESTMRLTIRQRDGKTWEKRSRESIIEFSTSECEEPPLILPYLPSPTTIATFSSTTTSAYSCLLAKQYKPVGVGCKIFRK